MNVVHQLTVEQDRFTNAWRGKCSCGRWQGGARRESELREAWRKHVQGRR